MTLTKSSLFLHIRRREGRRLPPGRHGRQQQPEQQQLLVAVAHVGLGLLDDGQQPGELPLHPREGGQDALLAQEQVGVVHQSSPR